MARRNKVRGLKGRYIALNTTWRCLICASYKSSQWRRRTDREVICNRCQVKSKKNTTYPFILNGKWGYLIQRCNAAPISFDFQAYSPVVPIEQCRFCSEPISAGETHCDYCRLRGFHPGLGNTGDILDAMARPENADFLQNKS